jgi:hypothetical protein
MVAEIEHFNVYRGSFEDNAASGGYYFCVTPKCGVAMGPDGITITGSLLAAG